ncbi:MAG: SpoIIE family protein phosphatase [Kiritimatiellia bacterium]|jgi:PAS domain S-box-containing protein|nr:SpoIIE family protein phosphatase [Kiritimatiellia bacterium]
MTFLSISPLSIPPLMMAGIMFYVAISHLLICRRRTRRRRDCMFAFSCFSMCLYNVFCAGLYSATSCLEGVVWQQVQVAALAVFAISFLWFVADYTALMNPLIEWAFSAYFLFSAFMAAIGGDLVFRADVPAIKNIVLPFGFRPRFFEVAPGPLVHLQGVVGLLAFAYVIWTGLRFYNTGDRKMALRLLQGVVIFLLGVLNDSAVSSGFYSFLYLLEYSYIAIVLVMAAALSRDIAASEHAEAMAHEMELKFQAVFKCVTTGIGMTTCEGKLLRANAAMCAMFGRAEENLVDTEIFDYFHPEAVSGMRESLEDLLRGDINTFRDEERYVRPDGATYWGDVSAGVIREPDGTIEAVTWVIIGITERRQASESLRALNEQLEEKVLERTGELTEANVHLAASLQRLREDEEAAEMIQFSLLPEECRILSGLGFSRYLVSSQYMSGDFVDYFEIDYGRVGFYMADVSGHGVSSAFVTVLLKSFMRRALERYKEEKDQTILEPAELLDSLNQELIQQNLGKHLTFFYGVMDTVQNVFFFSNGGHFPLPVLLSEGKIEQIEAKGSPLGLFDFADFSTLRRELPEHFLLTIFSDGILEVLPQAELADKLSFLESLADSETASISDIIDKVGLEEAESLPDDVTVLTVRRTAKSVESLEE